MSIQLRDYLIVDNLNFKENDISGGNDENSIFCNNNFVDFYS